MVMHVINSCSPIWERSDGFDKATNNDFVQGCLISIRRQRSGIFFGTVVVFISVVNYALHKPIKLLRNYLCISEAVQPQHYLLLLKLSKSLFDEAWMKQSVSNSHNYIATINLVERKTFKLYM